MPVCGLGGRIQIEAPSSRLDSVWRLVTETKRLCAQARKESGAEIQRLEVELLQRRLQEAEQRVSTVTAQNTTIQTESQSLNDQMMHAQVL